MSQPPDPPSPQHFRLPESPGWPRIFYLFAALGLSGSAPDTLGFHLTPNREITPIRPSAWTAEALDAEGWSRWAFTLESPPTFVHIYHYGPPPDEDTRRDICSLVPAFLAVWYHQVFAPPNGQP